jgi:hypothetical protein
MSEWDARRMKRRQAIVEVLSTQRLTMQEVAEAIDSKYHTIRNDVLDLAAEGAIFRCAETGANGAIQYQAMPVSVIPNLYFSNQDKHHNVQELTHHVVESGFSPTTSSQVPSVLYETLIELLELARAVNHGDILQKDLHKELIPIKKRLLQYKALADATVLLYKQVLDNVHWWEPVYLKQIGADAEFDDEQVRSDFEALMRYRNPEDNT